MTKKDYELLALFFVRSMSNSANDPETIERMLELLINALMRDNPRFNPDKFRKAAGF